MAPGVLEGSSGRVWALIAAVGHVEMVVLGGRGGGGGVEEGECAHLWPVELATAASYGAAINWSVPNIELCVYSAR